MKKEYIEKFHKMISFLIRSLLIIAVLLGFYEKNWMVIFVSSLTLFLTFLPLIIKRRYEINLPPELEIIIIIFLYASIFLGEVHGYYTRFWWWDSVLHFFSGMALGFAGFLILYILYKKEKLKASPLTIAIFAFCFALALGALWEIFEFGMDSFFGLDMQRSRNLENVYGECDTRLGVIDTMVDLILDAIGALIASIAGYFYLKRGGFFIFDRFVKSFEKENPKLFEN